MLDPLRDQDILSLSLGDFSDFKAGWSSVYINILLVVSTLLVRPIRLSLIAVIFA